MIAVFRSKKRAQALAKSINGTVVTFREVKK
jgi:nitrous oxide reductase accessory protein NosL